MKHLVLLLHVVFAGVFLISGCGQTGPLYLPKPVESIPASAAVPPTSSMTFPSSALESRQGEAQLPQSMPTTTIPGQGIQ